MLFWSITVRRLHSSLRKFVRALLDGSENDSEDEEREQSPDSSQTSPFFATRGRQRQSVSATSCNSPTTTRVNKAVKGRRSTSTTSSIGSAPTEKASRPPAIMLNVFNEALSCPVCLDEFRKVPKILPTCGHSFCLPCIEHWYEFSGAAATGILRCPVCKCKTNLRILQGGPRCLRKNSSIFGSHSHSDKQCRLPPPPQPTALRKLLCDSPTVGAVLKLRKRLAKLSPQLSSDSTDCIPPSTLQSMVSGLQTLLTCRACHFRLEEPRMLPACRHSFCTSCLQKIYKPLSTTTTTNGCDVGTIVCPACSTLYRFNYHPSSPPSSPPISTTKSVLSEDKHPLETAKPPPPKEKLATYLPFDYVLGCLLDAIPEKL